jgi:DNA-binding response OmpR family regulator
VDLPVNAPEIIFKADQEPSPVIIDEVSLTEFETEENEKTIRRAHIHLVEDNLDVLKFLQFELSETFDVTVSEDGLEAEAFVLENVPDLVITDVMMPKQDGFDLCRHLKTNPITSHVPIIMLTAFKTPHHEEEGLSLGADDYIAKPVSIRLLNLKVSNLLAQQERLREKIRLEYGLLPSNTSKIRAVDKEFLDKSEEIALRFLDDEFFGVEQFALEMGMSRSNFYKKFRDLTGLSPASYVKVKRLNEAARRIEERAGNITEIAFDVGFSDVSYFSRCFKDHFGCPPSKYISHKAENTVTDMNRSDS